MLLKCLVLGTFSLSGVLLGKPLTSQVARPGSEDGNNRSLGCSEH